MSRMPREIYEGTMGQIQENAKARAAVMGERHPDVRFSLAPNNPLGVKAARKLGVPGAGFPRAIFNKDAEPVDDPKKVQAIIDAMEKWKSDFGYTTYTTIQAETGLSFTEIFGVCRHLREVDPYRLLMSIDRLGANTCVRF